jgi:hypothetical protein
MYMYADVNIEVPRPVSVSDRQDRMHRFSNVDIIPLN